MSLGLHHYPSCQLPFLPPPYSSMGHCGTEQRKVCLISLSWHEHKQMHTYIYTQIYRYTNSFTSPRLSPTVPLSQPSAMNSPTIPCEPSLFSLMMTHKIGVFPHSPPPPPPPQCPPSHRRVYINKACVSGS